MLGYDPLDEFHDPAAYDLTVGDNEEELPLLEQWAGPIGGRILDLACGTGRDTISLAAHGYAVTGVDLVPEMIEQARRKSDERGVAVAWVVADARALHLPQRFAFAYMIGNAFQLFYTRADQETLLACVRRHLRPGGRFLFETRNPSPQNLYEVHHSEPRRVTAPDGTQLVVTEDPPVYDPLSQIQHYTSHYAWLRPDGQQVQQTKRIALRYVFPQEIEALLHYNGFAVQARYGSWQQEPLSATSREMIFVSEPCA